MAKQNSQTFDTISPIEQSAVKRAEKREDTRSHIARIFIWGYLVITGILIILSTFFNLPAENAKDYLLAIGSSLGFIIGYYFKSENQD